MTNYGPSVAGQAAPDATSGPAEVAREQAGQVATSAASHAQQVAGTASDQASAVAQHAADQARNVLDDAKGQAREQARRQTGQLADALERWRDQARALVDGRPTEAGAIGDMARDATDRLAALADGVRERGFDGIVADVQRFARRRPGTFLAGAAVLGFAAGRLVRSGAVTNSGTSGTQAGGTAPLGAPSELAAPPVERVAGTASPTFATTSPPSTAPLPDAILPEEGLR